RSGFRPAPWTRAGLAGARSPRAGGRRAFGGERRADVLEDALPAHLVQRAQLGDDVVEAIPADVDPRLEPLTQPRKVVAHRLSFLLVRPGAHLAPRRYPKCAASIATRSSHGDEGKTNGRG